MSESNRNRRKENRIQKEATNEKHKNNSRGELIAAERCISMQIRFINGLNAWNLGTEKATISRNSRSIVWYQIAISPDYPNF